MKKEIKNILISKEFEGLRLDQFLSKSQVVETRSQALKLVSEKKILLNNSRVKASYLVRSGDTLTVTLNHDVSESLFEYKSPLEILFEDEDILIVNKPAGLVVHPAPGHKDKTLVNILAHQKKLSPGSHPLRPGIVHRLDKNTSGLLLLTKSQNAPDIMIEQFKNRKVKREYWTVTCKAPPFLEDTLETWLGRHPIHRKKFISFKEFKTGSKTAITSYKVFRQSEKGFFWLKCHLHTGRTHQIRVHLSSISCPIVGDEIYGEKKKLSSIKDFSLREQIKNLNRIVLHAHRLSFLHPLSSKPMVFCSPWPSDLNDFLKKIDFL